MVDDVESRLPSLTPEELSDRQREVYEQIAGGRRTQGPQLFALTDDRGALTGPFNAFVHAPDIGAALGALGESIRYQGSLSDRIREIAILSVAAYHRSAFEWYAHERVARHIGLSDDEISAIRRLVPVELPSDAEVLAYEVCRVVLRDRDVPDALYGRAIDELGTAAVVELVMLVGYYQSLALLLSVFHVAAPEPVPWPAPGTSV